MHQFDHECKRLANNAATYRSATFRKACEIACVPPTHRQASKFNNGYGAAFAHRAEAAAQCETVTL